MGTCHTKTEDVVETVIRIVPVTIGAAQVVNVKVEGTAPKHAIFSYLIPIIAPLPHIPCHIHQSIRRCAGRIAAHRSGLSHFSIIICPVWKSIRKWIWIFTNGQISEVLETSEILKLILNPSLRIMESVFSQELKNPKSHCTKIIL